MKNKAVRVLITDTHLGERNIELVKDIFRQAIEICHNLKVDHLYFLGDFYQSRKGLSDQILIATSEIFELLHQENIKITLIKGNHDESSVLDTNSYLTVFKKHNINLIETWGYDIVGDQIHYFIPYFKETGELYIKYLKEVIDHIKKTKQNKKRFLHTHVGINGVLRNDGSSEETGLSVNLFKEFDQVMVGHFHDKNSINNISYIGSAYQANFGETTEKGVTVINEDGSHYQIKLNFPEFIKIEYNIDEIDKNVLEALKDIKNTDSRNIYRLEISGDESKLKTSDSILNQLKTIGYDIKTNSDEVNINIDNAKQEKIVLYTKDLLKDAFTDFCEENKIEEQEYGKSILAKL